MAVIDMDPDLRPPAPERRPDGAAAAVAEPAGPLEPHALTAAVVAERLGVDPAVGLTTAEAARRRALSGPNVLDEAKRQPLWRMLLEAATEPFVVMLAVAGLLAILVGEVRDGLLVLFGLLPIVGADVVTEFRGERALEALREASAPVARSSLTTTATISPTKRTTSLAKM